jgi:hypothetical protein
MDTITTNGGPLGFDLSDRDLTGIEGLRKNRYQKGSAKGDESKQSIWGSVDQGSLLGFWAGPRLYSHRPRCLRILFMTS